MDINPEDAPENVGQLREYLASRAMMATGDSINSVLYSDSDKHFRLDDTVNLLGLKIEEIWENNGPSASVVASSGYAGGGGAGASGGSYSYSGGGSAYTPT